MSGHTPGPWRIEDVRRGGSAFISGPGTPETPGGCEWQDFAQVVVRMEGDDKDSEEGIANAKLIASAPALADELATLATAASEMRCRCSLEEINSGHHVDCGKPALLERVDRALAVLALAGRLP
jgi:hypothetical protein